MNWLEDKVIERLLHTRMSEGQTRDYLFNRQFVTVVSFLLEIVLLISIIDRACKKSLRNIYNLQCHELRM